MRNRLRRTKAAAAGSSGYSGPVNLPEGLAAAMRKTHSYVWLDNAVKQDAPDDGGVPPPVPPLSPRNSPFASLTSSRVQCCRGTPPLQ